MHNGGIPVPSAKAEVEPKASHKSMAIARRTIVCFISILLGKLWITAERNRSTAVRERIVAPSLEEAGGRKECYLWICSDVHKVFTLNGAYL